MGGMGGFGDDEFFAHIRVVTNNAQTAQNSGCRFRAFNIGKRLVGETGRGHPCGHDNHGI